MNWDDTKILLAIGRTGGLSRSAKLLGVRVSTVHRRAAELEKSLNAILFSRDSDGYTLTHVGKRSFALAAKAEETFDRNGAATTIKGNNHCSALLYLS